MALKGDSRSRTQAHRTDSVTVLTDDPSEPLPSIRGLLPEPVTTKKSGPPVMVGFAPPVTPRELANPSSAPIAPDTNSGRPREDIDMDGHLLSNGAKPKPVASNSEVNCRPASSPIIRNPDGRTNTANVRTKVSNSGSEDDGLKQFMG